MATKKGKTLPEPEPKEPELGSEPEPKEPEPSPQPPELEERYQGKTIEEIVEMHKSVEKEKDRLGTEVGKLRGETDEARNNLAYYRNLAENLQAQTSQQGQIGTRTAGESIPEARFDYDNPIPSVEQIFDRKFEAWDARRQEEEKRRQYQEATMNYATGRNIAMEKDPKLFEGIERKVENVVWGAFQGGVIPSYQLREPKTWENAARLVHMDSGNYDRLVPPKVKPVSPTPTETPSATKPIPPEEKPITFRDDSKMLIEGLGGGQFDEKQVAEMVKKERKRRAELEE